MISSSQVAALLLLSQWVVAQAGTAQGATVQGAKGAADSHFGVLLMAHGGQAAWNEGVLQALEPLREQYPLQVAFGMADAGSLERAVRALEAEGVSHVAVVRLFVSGESWYQRTRQILGLEPGAPDKPAPAHTGHQEEGGSHAMGFWRIDTDITFTLSEQGLVEAEEMDAILLERARGLSSNPARENVLILAHGPGDDAENARWLEQLDARAELLRQTLPFQQVAVFTLREDWPEKRELAQQQVRDFIQTGSEEGYTTLVLPFRVQGFGPYAEVLEGLPYRADHTGLVPHANVVQWVARQIEEQRARLLAQLD
ncbi:MAG: CbiX/SirB N-terminal domain-containing protein [Pseudomonadales bacterium]|nr:CbiX/SirB N-terminal domain-containing protein [Pseudomonadales bacterium]